MASWHDKAHEIIAKESLASYVKANTKKDGRKYKTQRPYSIPVIAQKLVTCLNTNNEERAKGLIYEYSIHPDMFN